ncbi:RteC domain-containing protein [Ochrovirga pacifica]|uniref:RteC domain-containing protein n=1 Tax=Ochrovirga pacifica TaxID=1042376 RepID=UPI0002558B3D|nr:RteC domain-containing protein [Ochrovirga pacifica]
MEKINLWVVEYGKEIKTNNKLALETKEKLKQNIVLTKELLSKLREHVRVKHFESKEEEINFFKSVKPQICSRLKFFKTQLEYYCEMPFVSSERQIKYIQNLIKEIEVIRKNNISFFKYVKHEETHCDEIYFTRIKQQTLLFSQSEILDTDPLFTTSHDYLAAEVFYYNQIKDFLKQELYCLRNLQKSSLDNITIQNGLGSLSWTASKTDLVELIYALKVTGAINGGTAQVKDLVGVFESIFKIELGNYYKTFGEIQNRSKEQTKFLSKLSSNLVKKLDFEDA